MFDKLRYVLSAALCSWTVWLALTGFSWYGCVIVFCGAVMIGYGPRRVIFRVGVERSGDQIICRYVPLYEGYTYFGGVLVPLFGVATVAAGNASHNVLFWCAGILLLCVSALTVAGSLFMGRRNFLCVTPSALRLRAFVIGVGSRARAPTEIRRDLIHGVELKWNPDTFGPQVEIAHDVVHDGAGSGGTTRTVIRNRQLSVRPENLLHALTFWKEGADLDPGDRMDQVERLLRKH